VFSNLTHKYISDLYDLKMCLVYVFYNMYRTTEYFIVLLHNKLLILHNKSPKQKQEINLGQHNQNNTNY